MTSKRPPYGRLRSPAATQETRRFVTVLGSRRYPRGAGMYSRSVAVLAITAVGALGSLQAQKPTREPAAPVDFARDIQPILETHCYECHGPKKSRGHLRLDVRAAAMKGGESGGAIVPGKSDQSLIVRRILGLDGDDRMPKDGDPLPDAQIALIRTWIDQGAAWASTAAESAEPAPAHDPEPKHWAYRAPQRPSLPEVRNAKWVRTPIDQFVLARLEK